MVEVQYQKFHFCCISLLDSAPPTLLHPGTRHLLWVFWSQGWGLRDGVMGLWETQAVLFQQL